VKGRPALAAACVAALLPGCGGDGDGSDGPASLVPPDAALYAELLARPDGDLASTTRETLRRISGERDAGAAIAAFIDEELQEDAPELSFEGDIEPWLGDRVALFFEDLNDLEGAFIVEARDPEGAERFARDVSEASGPVEEASYEGEDYLLDAGGTAAGVIDDFLVFGDEVGVKDAIDASGGDSLAGEDAFDAAIDAAPGDSLADLYLSLAALGEAAPSELEADSTAFFDSLLRGVEGDAVVANLIPRGDAVELEVSSDAFAGLDGAAAADLVASLPGEAWGVAGLPDAGVLLRGILRGVEATGEVSIGELEGALGLVGISLERDLVGAIESVAVFVESGLEPLGGAAVISSSDGEATREAVETIGVLLQRIGDARAASVGGERGFSISVPDIGPEPVYVIPRDDSVVVGYGRAATERALAGGDPISAVPEFSQAAEMLGGDPIAYVAVPEALRVGEAFGYLGDPGIGDALPYLQRARYVAVAVEGDEDRGAFKVLVGLQR
jgi:Protein of unknown function (DUF3352)